MPTEPFKNNNQFSTNKNQFENRVNNIVETEINLLKLIEVTESLVQTIKNMDADTEKQMIDYLTDEALQEFCRVNQYFSFNSQNVLDLKNIYLQFNKNIRLLPNNANQIQLNTLSNEHYENLCNWLVKTNAFAGKLYNNLPESSQPVACSEYSPDLQISILHIDLTTLKEPILDIGCGRELNLVNYLRDNGLEAYGLDRFDSKNPYYTKIDWLEFKFEPNTWGSIISNLGFSNHFIHHNLRTDGNFSEYAQKYMEIIQSLQLDGSFYYAPHLPFIEIHLDKKKYIMENFDIENIDLKASRIRKLI